MSLQNHKLFSKIILQSPPTGLKAHSLSQAKSLAKKFASNLGCSNLSSDNTIKCLRSKTALEIIQSDFITSIVDLAFKWFPIVDNDLIKQNDIIRGLESIDVKNMSVLIGSNQDELTILSWVLERGVMTGSLVIKQLLKRLFRPTVINPREAVSYVFLINAVFRKASWRVLAKFPHFKLAQNPHLFDKILSDYLFNCPNLKLHGVFSKHGASSFGYTFEFQPDYLRNLGGSCSSEKVCHAVEIPYFFHSPSSFVSHTPLVYY